MMFLMTMATMLLSAPKASAQSIDFANWMEEQQDFLLLDWIEDGYEEYYDVEASTYSGLSTGLDGVFDRFDEILRSSEEGYTLFNQQFGSDDNGGYELYNQIFGQDANLDAPLGSGLFILVAAGAGYALKKSKSNKKH